jgi:hypothetical protein
MAFVSFLFVSVCYVKRKGYIEFLCTAFRVQALSSLLPNLPLIRNNVDGTQKSTHKHTQNLQTLLLKEC